MKQLNFGSTNGKPNDPNKTVVHCPTQELAQKVLRIADRWSLMDYWYDKESETCFDLMNDDYGTVEGYSEAGYTILPAEEFIRLNAEEHPDAEVANPFQVGDKIFHLVHGWQLVKHISVSGNLITKEGNVLSPRFCSFTPYKDSARKGRSRI